MCRSLHIVRDDKAGDFQVRAYSVDDDDEGTKVVNVPTREAAEAFLRYLDCFFVQPPVSVAHADAMKDGVLQDIAHRP